ncbi:unnamed protein product [Urochloa humidicola]
MKIIVHSSKSIKPAYISGGSPAATSSDIIPLTVFDELNHNVYISGIFFFHPPAPPITVLEHGLAKMLARDREWAGRLVVMDARRGGKRAILLNNAGAQLFEASADVALRSIMPLRMGPNAKELHPSCDGVKELLLVQVTRFTCGSFTVGYNIHHPIADSYAANTCMMAWGQAVRSMVFDPALVHDWAYFVMPQDPLLLEFKHREVKFESPMEKKAFINDGIDDDVVVETVHFSREFVSRLKSLASAKRHRPYGVVKCVAAHLWRCVTLARGLGMHEVTTLHIAVNGRGRMINPTVPEGYAGNVVLWARPSTTVRELLDMPLWRTVELISQEVARIDNNYFRSFIDFASSSAVDSEGLVRTTVFSELVMRTNVVVDSVLGIPFYDVDFGSGKPFLYMPSYSTAQPSEGGLYLVPAFSGDGGMVAYVPLFRRAIDTFTSCCYSLPPLADPRL